MGLKGETQLQAWAPHHGIAGWMCHSGLYNGEYRNCYTCRNVCILSDSQAVIKTHVSLQINSKLVWDCHQSLAKLAKHNRIQVVWVWGHMGIDGSEITDESDRQTRLLTCTHRTWALLHVTAKVATGLIKERTSRKHEECWQWTEAR
jgi:hypothetical protein